MAGASWSHLVVALESSSFAVAADTATCCNYMAVRPFAAAAKTEEEQQQRRRRHAPEIKATVTREFP